ncbi:MAG: hypothetical protein IJO34_06625 [Akkermansia sp.]|nr:hypothetical protein [Akkermansia sp.]
MNTSAKALISEERSKFHKSILKSLLICNEKGIPSNADKSQASSVAYAKSIFAQIGGTSNNLGESCAQTKGDEFEREVCEYIQATFAKLEKLRPGKWDIIQIKGRNKNIIGNYAQYGHLCELANIINQNPQMSAYLGNDYTVAPDVVIARNLESDEELNTPSAIVDKESALAADIREGEGKLPLLHASISCKWTLRSDRAQNARAEALNLIRNRKGRQPHIIVVTGEPTPSRLSSLALGTGDIDCVYHIALYELQKAVQESGNDEALSMLNTMIDGKRLKDISDLPLDLAI